MTEKRRVARRRPCRIALCTAALVAALGCVSDESLTDEWMKEASRRSESAPLGGEALVQRKIELDRSYRDLAHFSATFEGLQRREDRGALVMFGEFVDFYIGKHVLPLLEGEWQSRHPEVAVHDANVRFAVAELWLRMGASYSSDRMLDEIERRYAGRGEMVVAYPLGDEGTLSQGVARLRNRDWWDG